MGLRVTSWRLSWCRKVGRRGGLIPHGGGTMVDMVIILCSVVWWGAGDGVSAIFIELGAFLS